MYCENCGTKIDQNASFCPACGEAVNQTGQTAATATVEESASSSVHKDNHFSIYKFVGLNSDYYQRKWSKNHQPGTGAAWNWAAFFLAPYWLGYRKMYKVLFGYLGILLLINIIDFSLNTTALSFLGIVLAVLMGFYGNALYYRHAKKKMAVIQKTTDTREAEEIQLQSAGGRSAAGIWAAIGLMIVYIILSFFLMALLMPEAFSTGTNY